MSQCSSIEVDATEFVKALVLEIVREVVDQPEEVRLDLTEVEGATVFRLRVADQDIGKIIGKQGHTAGAMRTILAALSKKLQHRFTLDILEER